MARPRKRKRVCRMPNVNVFGPYRGEDIGEYIEMSVEEFETIRIIDYEGFTQEKCGEFMGIGRSTVQRLYEIARGKIADSMVNGRAIKIQGGDYSLCSQLEDSDRCGRCHRNRFRGGRRGK